MRRPGRLLMAATPMVFVSAGATLQQSETPPTTAVEWRRLETGLHLAEIVSPVKASVGDSVITVLRIDPAFFDFKLLSASEHENRVRTAADWARQFGLSAAINAGMYQEDGISSVGHMKNFDHVNNAYVNRNQTVLAFNAVDGSVPKVQIIDRTCQDFDELRKKYNTLIQSIRMVSCSRENMWSRQSRSWSISSVGTDDDGNVLFVFSRSPYVVHDFISILLSLPIGLRNLMYLEGGPEATLYVSANGEEIEKVGVFDSRFFDAEANTRAWPVPNVLGIVPRAAAKTD